MLFARLSGAVDVATGLADSCGNGIVADAMRESAGDGRFRIVEDRGRRVKGYWPERDPEILEWRQRKAEEGGEE